MRILIATPLYPPELGGPATHAKMAEQALFEAGHHAIVIPFSTVRRYPTVIRHLAYLFRLVQAVRSEDCIYALDAASAGVPAMLASLVTGKPLFVRIPGDFAWEQGVQRFGVTDSLDEFIRKPRPGFLLRAMQWAQRTVTRRALRVIVPSEYLKRVVAEWGVPPQKITVVYSAFAHAPDDPPPYRARPKRIVFAGRLVAWKGVPGLVRAFAKVRVAHPDAVLSIAGEGAERALIEKEIAESGVGGAVVMEGELSKERLKNLMRDSRIFALNTAYEGFSHVLLEAMDAGAVVVTTRAGGNTELVDDGATGILVPYNDEAALAAALSRVLNDDLLAETISRAARNAVVARFSNNIVSNELIRALSIPTP